MIFNFICRQLNLTVNYLITIDAFCVAVTEFAVLMHYTIAIWAPLIDFSTCFAINVVPIFALEYSTVTPLMIAFDRFLHVFFPLWSWLLYLLIFIKTIINLVVKKF